MFKGHRRLNLSLPFLACALLLATACGTMEAGAQQPSVLEEGPAVEWAHTEPTTLSDHGVVTVVSTSGADSSDSITEFEALLMRAVEMHDYGVMRSLMGDSFVVAGWQSEGWAYTPGEATAQLRANYLGAEKGIHFQDAPDLSQELDGRDILSVWNPAVNPVSALFSLGWGTDGKGEAFLIVAQRSDGTLYWEGLLLAPGRFVDGGVAQPPREPSVTISPLAGPSGTLVQVAASGFEPYTPVMVGAGPENSEFGEVARGTTDANGAFTVHVPAQGAPGMNLVFAVAVEGQPGVSSPDLFHITEAVGSGGTVLETGVRYVMALPDAVSIYGGPGDTYPQIGVIFGGMAGTVTGVSPDGRWWRVMCPDDTVGSCWVSADPTVTEPTTPPGS